VLIEKPEQNLAGDVVRDIPNDAEALLFPAEELIKRYRADICVHDFDRLAEQILQNPNGPLIKLDSNETPASPAQVLGERALPRTDLNDNIVGTEMQALDNVARNILVTEEILSEGFFWWKHVR